MNSGPGCVTSTLLNARNLLIAILPSVGHRHHPRGLPTTACLSRHDLALVPPDDSVDGGKVRGEDAVACDDAGVGVAAIQERDAVDGDPGIACNALVDNAVQLHATEQAFHAPFDLCI